MRVPRANLTATLCTLAFTACNGEVARSPELVELDRSQDVWSALVEEHGDTYWYEARTCDTGERDRTFVQVIDGAIADRHRVTENGVRCEPAEPNLYGGFSARTLDDLYSYCVDILQGPAEDNPTLAIDEAGVVQTCTSFEFGCNDACANGFHLAERHFGQDGFPQHSP